MNSQRAPYLTTPIGLDLERDFLTCACREPHPIGAPCESGHVCEHGRNLDCELCERCAADDAELDAL